jgi:hypothetical protein
MKNFVLKHKDKGYFQSFVHQGHICFWADDKEDAQRFKSEEDAVDYNHEYLHGECIVEQLKKHSNMKLYTKEDLEHFWELKDLFDNFEDCWENLQKCSERNAPPYIHINTREKTILYNSLHMLEVSLAVVDDGRAVNGIKSTLDEILRLKNKMLDTKSDDKLQTITLRF